MFLDLNLQSYLIFGITCILLLLALLVFLHFYYKKLPPKSEAKKLTQQERWENLKQHRLEVAHKKDGVVEEEVELEPVSEEVVNVSDVVEKNDEVIETVEDEVEDVWANVLGTSEEPKEEESPEVVEEVSEPVEEAKPYNPETDDVAPLPYEDEVSDVKEEASEESEDLDYIEDKEQLDDIAKLEGAQSASEVEALVNDEVKEETSEETEDLDYIEDKEELEDIAKVEGAPLVKQEPKVDNYILEAMKDKPVNTFINSDIYKKSLVAKLVLESSLKDPYKVINDHFLSYKKVSARLSFNGVRYSSGRSLLGKLLVRGKKIYLYLALEPSSLPAKYYIQDVSDKASYASIPALLKVKSNRSVNYACELIDILMMNKNIDKLPENKIKAVDYDSLLYPRTFKELFEQGEIKLVSVAKGEDIVHKPVLEISPEEVDTFVTDEKISKKVHEVHIKHNGPMAIVNIGQISEAYRPEETVDLESLKEKGLISKKAGRVKILANGALDKKLNVIADDYSKQAIKMIYYMGGNITIIK